MVEYNEYMTSNDWRERANRRLAYDSYRCQRCGTRGEYHKVGYGQAPKYQHGLEVHHLTYANLGGEPQIDLITLCSNCHGLTHAQEKEGCLMFGRMPDIVVLRQIIITEAIYRERFREIWSI